MFGHEGFQFVQFGHHGGGTTGKRMAGICEPDATALWLEQRHPKCIFELANVHGNGGLRDEQAFSGFGYRSLACHFHEGLDLLEGVVAHNKYQKILMF